MQVLSLGEATAHRDEELPTAVDGKENGAMTQRHFHPA
jgi:hypothetical protein